MIVIVFLAAILSVTAQQPEWDVPGAQGRVGFVVRSGRGEPLSIQLVPMQAGELKGAIAMRVYADGQRLGLHMGPELDGDTAIDVPNCTDTVKIIVLRGRNFDSELDVIDSGIIAMETRPITAIMSGASINRVKGKSVIIVDDLRVTGSAARSNLNVSIEIVDNTLRDTSGAPIRVEPIGEPIRTQVSGQAVYSMEMNTYSRGNRPYLAKMQGSLEVRFTVKRVVCGRYVQRTLTKVITIPNRN